MHIQPNICNDLWVIQWVIISEGTFTPLKHRIVCLIRSHALTAGRPTLTIVVIQSGIYYCQIFSSVYILYIWFQSFRLFIVVSWPMLVAHWLFTFFALFLMWLFLCLVVLRVSVISITNWLLFVWTCFGNHILAACHFHNITYNWYISVICLDLCHKFQSGFFWFLPRLKA